MPFLNPTQKHTLTLICDTLVPTLPAQNGDDPRLFALSAAQMNLAGALDPSGESYEVRNLYVADGSVLPTASGANPMVSIMATAHFLAQAMKARM